MKNILKFFVIGLFITSIAGGFVGCAPKEGQVEQMTVTVWHWWGDQQPMLKKMAADYEEESGVKVKMMLIGSDYFKKLQASAAAKTLPDIIGLAGGGDLLARYINADRIYELTEELNKNNGEWRKTFFPRALEAFFYEAGNAYKVKDDSFWGIPLTVMNIQIYYHKDMFVKAGLDPEKPPKTWGEFLEISEKLNAAGISPFVAGLSEPWIDYTFFNAYCWTYLGKENMKKLYTGELPYTNDGCLKAMQRVVDMRVHKILYPGTINMNNKTAEINFANKKAAMMLNGSWAVNVYQGIASDELELGVFPFPKPVDAEYPMYLFGGVGKGVAVTTSSEYPEEAIAFLKWFVDKDRQSQLAKESKQIPANSDSLSQIDPLLKGFAQGMTRLNPDIKLEEKNEVREILSKGLQSIILGEVIPQNVLQKAREEKEKIMKKK
ncbi:extracellular solute-binding protein [bacterium]|nr:extracellular solute-binding protein [bacterium]